MKSTFPKGFMGSKPIVGVWFHGVMVSQRPAKSPIRNDVHVRIMLGPFYSGMEQLEARWAHIPEVRSSSLRPATQVQDRIVRFSSPLLETWVQSPLCTCIRHDERRLRHPSAVEVGRVHVQGMHLLHYRSPMKVKRVLVRHRLAAGGVFCFRTS